jgi:SAM-dependent methyltransferase
VDGPPEESPARREELKRWAQQQVLLNPREPRVAIHTRLFKRLASAPKLLRQPRAAEQALDRVADRLFDRGLDTAGREFLYDHTRDDRVAYVPSPWHLLPRTLRHIEVSDRDTFVDFGCGKGRVVHQAARRWPFRRVIGVEVSPKLAEIARTALAARAHRHRCKNVEIVAADAREFQVPDDLTVGYFFRPFGEETLRPLLRDIIESIDRNPRRVWLIYVWPKDRSLAAITESDRFRLVKELPSSLIDRHSDPVVIFESC